MSRSVPGDGGRREGHGEAVQVRVQVIAEPAEGVVVLLVAGGEVLQLSLVGGDRLRDRQRVRLPAPCIPRTSACW
ncbi:hypothetical protein [Streptomyces flaveolus]|uniref:hypothetical protein n=1 Tax=Streptomyces flaveolus TaxID=67297 RepID=UPI0036F8485E